MNMSMVHLKSVWICWQMEAIRNLSDRPDGKKIPIIARTANAFAEDVQAALNAGMDDHVAKPVDMEIITSVITKYVER
ncbi:response regulator [Ruminococcus sp. AF37-6AT]|nr:response regulator [Ruminococcus sp. AF37-6AT]